MIAGTVKGSWNRSTLRLSDESLTAGLFSVWFDHGTDPSGKSYSYILVPGAVKKELVAMEKKPSFKIINLPDRQEVLSFDGKTGGVIFYNAGKSEIFGGIEVDKPCLVMLKKQKGNIEMSIADPTCKQSEIKIKGADCKSGDRTIQLPKGGEAGKSVTIKW